MGMLPLDSIALADVEEDSPIKEYTPTGLYTQREWGEEILERGRNTKKVLPSVSGSVVVDNPVGNPEGHVLT